jgi:hypothetical protein
LGVPQLKARKLFYVNGKKSGCDLWKGSSTDALTLHTRRGFQIQRKKTLQVLLRVLKSSHSNLHILCFEDLLVGQLDDALGVGERIHFFFTSY